MKRSEINLLIKEAQALFGATGWTLPPHPRWDVTDFGLGQWQKAGLVLINLAEEPEYCEKLMYAREGMVTPTHTHRIKKEDIVCRWGKLSIELSLNPKLVECPAPSFKVDGAEYALDEEAHLELQAGQRVTLRPGVFHRFQPVGGPAVIGEVSTANDDLHDNVFTDAGVGRYTAIVEDEPATVRLLNEPRSGDI